MNVIVYPGPPEAAVAALQQHLAANATLRVATQSWKDDNMVVVYYDEETHRRVRRTALAVVAAIVLAYAGISMITLRSVEGNTVAEIFDNAVGLMSIGLALLAAAYAVS